MRRSLLLVLTLTLLLGIGACSPTSLNAVPDSATPCPIGGSSLASQWFNQQQTFRLRHEGILRIGSKTIPMTGFMILNTREGTADIVILTGLGIKIATLDVTRETYDVVYASPMAQFIPGFLKQAALSIQRTFLTDFPQTNTPCFLIEGRRDYIDVEPAGTLRSSIDLSADFMTGKAFKSKHKEWSVRYEGTTDISGIIFPERFTYTGVDRNYAVVMQLKSAKRQ